MASGWRRAHRSCKGKPSLPLYLLWLKRCHQGNKAFSRGARSPEWPLSPFSVASYCCDLAPDISSKVTFGEEIVEKFKARAVWLCRRSFGGRARRHDWKPRKEAAYSGVRHSWGRPPHLGSWIESSGAAQEKEKSRRKVQIGGSAEKEYQLAVKAAVEQGWRCFPKKKQCLDHVL